MSGAAAGLQMRLPVLTREGRRVLYAWIAVVVLFVLGDIARPGFSSSGSIQSVLVVSSFVGLVAAGQFFVVLVGGIDLSIPWVLNAAAILLVTTSLGQNARAAQALVLTLGMGLLAGVVNGIGVALFGVSAVVMTLAMNGIMEGLTLGLSGGLTCGSCASYAPPAVQSAVNGHLLGIPAVLWLWLLIALIISGVLGVTRFGRQAYAIGNNARAAFLAGVNVRLMTILLYGLSGLFAALGGVLLVGFGGQASLGMGAPYLFQSIAAVVIGGVYILGGRGHYVGVVAGAISLTALVSVLMAMNMPEYGRNIIYGVVILVLLLLYGREEGEA